MRRWVALKGLIALKGCVERVCRDERVNHIEHDSRAMVQ